MSVVLIAGASIGIGYTEAFTVGAKPLLSVIDFTGSNVEEVNAINLASAADFPARMGFGELLKLKQ